MPYVRAVPWTSPPPLVRPSKSFRKFYLLQHSGRKLTWLSYCSSRILGRGYYLTYEEIKDATAIPDNEQRNLQSRACTKFKPQLRET
ncbi:hypothetical protein BGY98DRAFT_726585 [Russula aff. rugulosa BPL654]|nr:hypothetical protein BGY98DRAFT_726585 [Russula aff. rugulosa BPL654]